MLDDNERIGINSNKDTMVNTEKNLIFIRKIIIL